MPDWPKLVCALADAGVDCGGDAEARPVGGGDISAAWRLDGDAGPLFLKTGPRDRHTMFLAEALGLEELGAAGAVRVPEVLAHGVSGSDSFLTLEWIELDSASAASERKLGRQLAELHRTRADAYGWKRDNTIGATPQHNPWTTDWVAFYRDHRLRFQLELAAQNGFDVELRTEGRRLLDSLTDIFGRHAPSPSLLHGDLWGGNHAAADGEPVIFDPAVYYGDRETDLAMTRLFGGFSREFYDAYESAWPLPPGHAERLPIYQLYHVLNHLNLFGRGYLGRAGSLIRQVLAAR